MRRVLLLILLAAAGGGAVRAADVWRPDGTLWDVSVIPDCRETGGGVARATPARVIFYCPRRVAAIDVRASGAAHFFFVHEYGHIALQSGDEREADCWAAREFRAVAGAERYVEAAAAFVRRYSRPHPDYGDGAERAARILRCFQDGGPARP